MICESHFRLKKNGEPDYRCFCKDFTKVENYSKAVLDTTQTWDCHHRLETHYKKGGKWVRREQDVSMEQLIEDGKYYDVPPEELIFLTEAEHMALHRKGKKQGPLSEETKRKIGEALKNRKDQSKRVLRVETGEIFDSTRDAERKTGIAHSHISSVCNGRLKTTGGFHWKYYAP